MLHCVLAMVRWCASHGQVPVGVLAMVMWWSGGVLTLVETFELKHTLFNSFSGGSVAR